MGILCFHQALPVDSLSTYQIQKNDAIIASDHLPVVGDFTLKTDPTTGVFAPRSVYERSEDLSESE